MELNQKNVQNENTQQYKSAIPELLSKRLEYRKISRIYWIISLVFNVFLIILGGFYFDCYYYTRKYITDGDYFWEFHIEKDLRNKAVPLNSILNGMVCVLTFFFNLMNLVVIGLYIIFGGVRDRIIFASKLFLYFLYNRLG